MLISEGKVFIQGHVALTLYTEIGLKLSDSSSITADAVIWCTGFADFGAIGAESFRKGTYNRYQKDVLTPEDIVSRMDAC